MTAIESTANLTSEKDDVEVLREHLRMPELPYVDFSARRSHAQALARWPLFAELAEESGR